MRKEARFSRAPVESGTPYILGSVLAGCHSVARERLLVFCGSSKLVL